MSIAILHRNRDCPHNEGVDEVQKQKELADLAAIAKDVRRHEAAAERGRKAIRAKLPDLRAAGVGPADLERAIHSVFVAGTISRWTVEAAGTGRKNREAAES